MKRIVTILFAIVAITAQAQTGIPQQYIGLGLPMICITTADGQEPTSEGIMHPEGSYVGASITNVVPKEARMQIYRADTLWYDSGEYLKDESGIKIKHRGNTSAYHFDNKPFKLSLQKKADLIIAEEGDTVNRKSKDWVLLNNAVRLQAMIANRMARLIGMEYAYDFSFYASRIGLADNCETQFKLVGKDSLMVTLDASGNVDKTVTIPYMFADNDGIITLKVSAGPGNSNPYKLYYINALRISAYIPDYTNIDESSSEHQYSTRKFIRDKHLYIVKDNRIYSPDGKRIK